ncbi:aspartate--tRNA ligase [Paraburkholderia caledonica]|uniref:Aspartate--tRNA(Asp/Asn) ligase n=1 Tax=Paraburkholderia caledonica TaxID=134536 RepID=A0AB73IN75_9BURK|nr:aspartyl-tRNA synthetase [Paraburkholderia caledonica]
MLRTHTCGELSRVHVGNEVQLSGWLRNRREHGGVMFVDLADQFGITQCVIAPDNSCFEDAASISKETVISIKGVVVDRDGGRANAALSTGEIEIQVRSLEILGSATALPFPISPNVTVAEELRLKYRYLDLRRDSVRRNMLLRSKVIASIRRRMWALGFEEFQTPTLTASSPEGARDYVVPSRRFPGKFYALPQAPQQFKQLLMIAGFDRYFQIAPCYRDEDSRADRSPGEFYQLDIEMSFVEQSDVFNVVEDVLAGLFTEFRPDKPIAQLPFPQISYAEAMLTYGSDKPDLRNPLRIVDVSTIFDKTDISFFKNNVVRAIKVQLGQKPRSFFDDLQVFVKNLGANGLGYITVSSTGSLLGPIAKVLSESETSGLTGGLELGEGDAVFFFADKEERNVCKILGAVRTELGTRLDLIESNVFKFCWITDFPFYEFNVEKNKIEFSHNPFSMPQGGLESLATSHPLDVKAFQYDVVCNGIELSSGAIRNHRPDIMYKAFEIAGYSKEELEMKFAGMINALKFGAPPHGGIAPGVDRIVMLLADEPNIREIILFPLNQNGEDLMMNAPSPISDSQLRELGLLIKARG